MPRPRLRRWVTGVPQATYFKPQGIPLHELEEVRLSVEGLEALRLADLEGLTTEAAAVGMGVSRHTFGRVLAEARATVARALVRGAALRIGGGHYEVIGDRDAADCDSRARAVPYNLEDTVMRQGGGGQGGRGGGQGRCGQGHGQGRGQGQGRGGGQCGQGRGQGAGQAAGPAGNAGAGQVATDTCVCPQCGQTLPHAPGTSCASLRCPACGAAMARQ